MKAWFHFLLLLSIMLSLLLGFGAQTDHHGALAGDHFGPGREKGPVASLLPARVVDPTVVQNTLAAPPESVVLDCARAGRTTSPPLRDLHGPPETRKDLGQMWVNPSLKITNKCHARGFSGLPFPPNYRIGLLQQPLAR
jgi:hypothetical protein